MKKDKAGELIGGIDLGTSAVRALLCTLDGAVVSAASADFTPTRTDGPRREQDADEWWRATCAALRAALARIEPARVRAVAVDATSGTIVMVNRRLEPLGPGLMYNDGRAAGYGERINAVAGDFLARHGYRFKDDFALAKLLWLRDCDPAFPASFKILHQADFINARLAGAVTATDWSTALKTGCDLHRVVWPDFIGNRLALPLDMLPDRIVAPGAPLGTVCAAAAAATGLRAGTPLVAGASDGTASLLASGARLPGDFNTSLGSTIILKGIAAELLRDPAGAIYCHRHPAGHWLPGGASNVGCAALNREFAPDPAARGAALAELDRQADAFLPSPILAYPLGDIAEERFPFKKSGIAAWLVGDGSREARYAGFLQAIAFVERWCYEKIEALGAPVRQVIGTGGGSKSAVWRQLRADVLRKPLLLPEQTETAFGAALLAAGSLCGGVAAAAGSMVRFTEQLDPGSPRFEDQYRGFRAECSRRWGV
jgi:sugar (pentulose or hexulose) kinase